MPAVTVVQAEAWLDDPHSHIDNRDRLSIRFAVYDALVRRGRDGDFRPALAVDWTCDEDARTWQFRLRPDVYFHDGGELLARDVTASLDRARDPGRGGELGTRGLYQQYLAGARIEAQGNERVSIVTPAPMADLLDLLAEIPIVARRAVDDPVANPVGTGPFRVAEAGPDYVVTTAFARFWGIRPRPSRVVWRAEPDAGSRVALLLNGRADVITDPSPAGLGDVAASARTLIVDAPSSTCVAFLCNATAGVCADRRVRQALNYGLDVSALTQTIGEATAEPLNGPLTPRHFGHDPLCPRYDYDPARARALLADAGYRGVLRIVADVPRRLPDEAPRLVRAMAEQYAAIGVSVEIREFADRAGYAEMVRAKRIDDVCCFDSTPLSTYRVLREKLHSGVRGPWWQGYTNPMVDALLDRAAATNARAARAAIYRRAYRLIRDDAPWIFLYSPRHVWAATCDALWRPGPTGTIVPA